MSRKLLGTTGLLIVFVILISVNMLSNVLFKSSRVDMTEGKLYTLSDGTRNIVRGVEEPIKLRFFFSEKATAGIPSLKSYATRVRELLEEYAQQSGGKIQLEVIDPVPFTEEEDQAVAAGMQGAPISQGENAYFGLEGTNSTDGKQTIPFFSNDRAQFLEYDVSALIHNLNNPKKSKIAIVTPLPINGDDNPMSRMGGQEGKDPWVIVQQLREQYDVEVVKPDAKELPKDTDVLMVIHPKNFSQDLQYAIDQHIASGKSTMLFVDPKAETDQPPQDPSNPMASMFAPKNSDLPEILKNLGLELEKGKIAADRSLAQKVTINQTSRPETVPYVLYINLREGSINRDEVPTGQLRDVNVASAGILKRAEDVAMKITPIFETTKDAQALEASEADVFPDPKKLYTNFKSGDEKLMIAALAKGKYKTAFPKGPEGGNKADNHIDESKNDVNVLVVADTDLLTDRFWVQVQRFMGQKMLLPMASNGDFVINFADYFGGSSDLISIRGRGKFNRPFTKVQKLEEEASKRFASKEKELQDKLDETEKKLTELQSNRADANNTRFLTPEQKEELEKFEKDRLDVRKELRGVKAQLRDDVEALGTKLKFLNIGLIPLLVGLLAVAMGWRRVRRRRRI